MLEQYQKLFSRIKSKSKMTTISFKFPIMSKKALISQIKLRDSKILCTKEINLEVSNRLNFMITMWRSMKKLLLNKSI